MKSSCQWRSTQKMQTDEEVLDLDPVSDTSLFFDNNEYDLSYNEGSDNNKMVSVTVVINSQPVTLGVDNGACLTLVWILSRNSCGRSLTVWTQHNILILERQMGKCKVMVTYRTLNVCWQFLWSPITLGGGSICYYCRCWEVFQTWHQSCNPSGLSGWWIERVCYNKHTQMVVSV